MKTSHFVIIVFALPIFSFFPQVIGEPISPEKLDDINKIIALDERVQKIINGKPFIFTNETAYAVNTETRIGEPIFALNVNNETTIIVLFSLQENKILNVDSYRTLYSTPQEIQLNPNETTNQETESQSIEEKIQIARKSVMQESDKPGSSSPFLDRSTIVIPVIVGTIIGTGSFFGLMFYWRKRK